MKLTLVCCTLGARLGELRRFFDSINPGAEDIQLIVVDQSKDGITRSLVEEYSDRFEIVFVQSAPGLSRARNAGLPFVTGDVVAFPDDDCLYSNDVIRTVLGRFESDSTLAGLSGCWVDEHGVPSGHPWPGEAEPITDKNAWRTAISFTLFFRVCSVQGLSFDPDIGVGSGTQIGAGEETLYLLQVLRTGARVVYDPSIRVHHPWAGVASIPFRKAYGYAIGFGYVAAVMGYSASFLVPRLLAPWMRLLLAGLSSDLGSAKYQLALGLGRPFGLALAGVSRGTRKRATTRG
jgi:glycosyltransferase involved in cell wall biosynthesis